MAEQKFDISINRVEKIPVPLLVVGLGGTGCDALLTIKEVFAERYVLPKNAKGQTIPVPAKTAYLAIDSRSDTPDGFETGEYVDISDSGIEAKLSDQKRLLSSYERGWVNRDLRHVSEGKGMGTVRQAARLALCDNYGKVYNAIKGALNNIVSINAGTPDPMVNQLEIVVVTGIGGGTGSGIFLDMAQILRAAATKEIPTIPAKVTGYIVMPDVSLANIDTASGMEDPIKRNSYAALKELDFWMRVKQHETPYSMQYDTGNTIDWDKAPFDHCVLISKSNVAGRPYRNGYDAVRNTIAENLMHYLAKEDSTGNAQYSYRQYEDNLSAIDVEKKYPLNYAYRAIGAFTKRIPKKPVLYYEGSILFKTFIPLRDDSGKMKPDRSMFTDGMGKSRALEITGVGKQLMQEFRTNTCKMPDFCYLDLNDKIKVTSVQNMNPAPHNRWHNKREEYIAPAAEKAAKKYLDQAWERFVSFAKGVIMDPNQGPFALEMYLDEENGLLKNMDEILQNWTNQSKKIHTQLISDTEAACAVSWPTFRKPPMVGRKKALEQYDYDLKTLYTNVINDEFLANHVESLKNLILRIKEYLKDGLKPMCRTILALEKEFNTAEEIDATLVQDIYDLSTVKQSIDDKFKEENAENKLSKAFLAEVTDISFATKRNVDDSSSGVEFTYRSAGQKAMCEFLQKKLEEVYGSVNDQSLDAIMIANVGTDISEQQKWMSDLAKSALDSALPMFMQDSTFAKEEKAPYSYMSIPEDAKQHLAYIATAFSTNDPKVQPKASAQKDHIYTLMTWDKLPLYRYALLEDLRTTYDQYLENEKGYGMHLVRNGDPDGDYMSDWSQLPSPKPYFLFSDSSVHSEMEQYKKVKALVRKAIDCGMITVHNDQTFASATVNLFYVPGSSALMTGETMMAKVKEIEQEKNPATGAVYSQDVIATRLNQFLSSGKQVILKEPDVKPASVSSVLGLEHEPCDPEDDNIKGNLTALEKAWENHKKLCVVMTEAMVYLRPDLVRALQLQADAYAVIQEKIHYSDSKKMRWEKRNGYAENAADIFVFLDSIIFRGTEGFMYKESNEKYCIINPEILTEDLKDVESELLKTMCFLADAPEENAAKADLTRLMTTAKRQIADDVNEQRMTSEQMDAVIQAISKYMEKMQEEKDRIKHLIHLKPESEDELNPQVDMIEAVVKALKTRLSTYQDIAKELK